MAPLASLVIPTHDRPLLLAELLASLRAQTVPVESFEVIVVDDGSGPETGALLRDAVAGDPSLRVLRQDPARGPAAARNAGWQAAAAPLVGFVDDDCVATPGWLEAALTAAADDPGAIVQGATLPRPDQADRLGPFSHTLRIDSPSPWFETCNLFYPRSLLERLGGFDETFRGAGGEDTDLGCRAVAAGARYHFVPAAKVHHAVTPLGPLGSLRIAARWTETVQVFRRHPELRRHLRFRVFWRDSHYRLTRAALAYALPRRGPAGLLRAWVLRGFVRYAFARAVAEDVPLRLAPYLLLRDAVEMAGIVRGAVRYRTPLL